MSVLFAQVGRNSPIVAHKTNVDILHWVAISCNYSPQVTQGEALKGDHDSDFLLLLIRFLRRGMAELMYLCVLQCIGLYLLGIPLVMVSLRFSTNQCLWMGCFLVFVANLRASVSLMLLSSFMDRKSHSLL